MLARENRRRSAALAVLQPFSQLLQVQLRDAGAERRDLPPQLLGPLGGGCLQRKRPQPLLHFRFDVARALDLNCDARELQLGSVLALLEAAESRGFFEQLAALFRLRAEDLLHAALADDGVHPTPEAEVGEQLDEIDPADGGAVEQVLALAPAMEPTRDRELRVGQRPVPVRIVEEQLDLAEIFARPPSASREEDVVRLLGPELGRRQGARGPDDGIGDVRLPGAVRPHDHGHARLEANLDRIRERLEAAQLDGA